MTAVRDPVTGVSGVAAHAAQPAVGVRRVRIAARVMLSLQITLVTWACLRGWFFNDDYVFRGQGGRYPWFDPAYLFQPWGGHLMPAGFAVAQFQGKLGDFSYTWVALTLAVGQAVVALLVYRFLVRHFGYRWRILLPLALYLTSIPVLQASVWWAAALNALPMLACLVIVADHTLRIAGGRRWGDYAWIVGATIASLAFFEKSVLIPVVVVMLLLATTPGPTGRPSPLRVVRRHWVLIAGLVVVLIGWYAVYRANKTSDMVNLPSLPTLSDQLSVGLVGTFVPSLFGGPWDWGSAPNGYTLVTTSPQVVVVLTLVTIGIALFLMASGPRARVALAMVAVYAVCLLVLVNVGRSQFLVATSGLPRYYADLTVVTVIATALSTARLVRDPAPEMLREWSPRVSRRSVVAVVAAAQVLLLSWLSASTALATGIGTSPEIPWVTTSLRSLRAASADSPILERAVPFDVLSPLATPYNDYAWFYAGVRGIPAFSAQTDSLRVLDEHGALVPGHVAGPATEPGREPDCGWRVDSDGRWIPMAAEIVNWRHTLQVAYIANGQTDLVIEMPDGSPTTVHLNPGLHDVFTLFDGGGTSVRLRAVTPGVTVCVGSVRIGEPVPGMPTP